MAGFMTVCRKELADHLGSKRYIVLFALIAVLSTLSAYQGALFVRSNPQAGFSAILSRAQSGFSFTVVMVFFGPIIGLALGFDAINKEKTSGSLSVLLSQPIFRDSVLNGKFLAGIGALSLLVVSTIGIMCGVAILLLGFGPTLAETLRILIFTPLTIVYLSFWLALGLLYSTVTKKTTTSILMAVATWLFFAVVITIVAALVANAIAPITVPTGFNPGTSPGNQTLPGGNQTRPGGLNQTTTDEYRQLIQTRYNIQASIQRVSPSYLYSEATSLILGTPTASGFLGLGEGTPFRPLEASQGIAASWPQVTALIVGLVVCFASAYMLFLRQEIRAGD